MPTDKPRFTITVDDDLYNQITEYRFSNRMKNQTQAVLSLIDKGLAVLSGDHIKDLSSCEEENHIKKYRTLDEYGKEAVDAVLEVEYRRCHQDVTEFAAARNGQRVRIERVENPDDLLPSEDLDNI